MTGCGIGCHFSRYFTAFNSVESYPITRCSSYIIDDGRNHGTGRRYTTPHSSSLAFSRYQLSRSSWTRFGGCTWIINGIHDGANRTYTAQSLLLCFRLQDSRIAVVSSTAAATLRQLVMYIFEKVINDKEPALPESLHSMFFLVCDRF
jgi:Dimerisation and cyclophilin-binding domain of Mon2